MQTRPLAALVDQIRKLSRSQLATQIEGLAAVEHVHVARLIAHLAEVSRRRLPVEQGYSSLFDYCVKRLGLPEGCTALRVQVSRVCDRHPLILDALAERRISLTVAGKLAPHMTHENRERLIAECAGMTKREVEVYLVQFAPRPVVTSGVRRRPSAGAETARPSPAGAALGFAALGSPVPGSAGHGSAGAKPKLASEKPARRSSAEPCRPATFNLRFAADQAFMDKLERAAELAGIRNVHEHLAEIFEIALDVHLSQKDPEIRQARREKRVKALTQAETTTKAPPKARQEVARSRFLPIALRDRLLIRAGHRCEYRSSEGLRCSERTGLTIDHVMPFARRGSSDEQNLRVLCAAHNRLHADRCFGAEFMNRRVESARLERGAGADRKPRPDEFSHPDRVREPAVTYSATHPSPVDAATTRNPNAGP